MVKIYKENQTLCRSSIEDFENINNDLQQMMDNKELYYLKSVEHKGIKLPVTLIIDNFVDYYYNKKYSDKNHTKLEMYDCLNDTIKTMITVGCGAMSVVMMINSEFGFFDKKSTNQTGENILGFVILIDKTVEKYFPVDALVYHEYYHCMKQNGILSRNYYNFLKYNKFYYTPEEMEDVKSINIGIDPQEEMEADQFARDNTIYKLKLYKLPKMYCDMNNINNLFKRLYVYTNLYMNIILSGRKLFS